MTDQSYAVKSYLLISLIRGATITPAHVTMHTLTLMAAGAGDIPIADATSTVLHPRRAHAMDLSNARDPASARRQNETPCRQHTIRRSDNANAVAS